MPDFPRYQSKGQLTTQQPSVQAAEDTSGEIISKVGEVGKVAQDATLRLSNAYDSMQKTQASLNFRKAVAEEQSKFLSIPNPTAEDLNKTNAAIQKSKETNLRGFSSKTAETETAMNFDYQSQISSIQLNDYYQKKNLEKDYLNTQELIDLEISNPSNDTISNIKKITDGKKAIYGEKEANKLYKDSVHTFGQFAVANDTADQEANSEVLAELKKGDKGKFSEIQPDDRLSLIKASQQRIFNNNQTYKRDVADSQNIRSNALIDKFAAGEATLKDIEAELAVPEESGGIKRTQLLTYQRALTSGIKGDLDRMLREKTPDKDPTKRAQSVKKYLDLIDNFIDNTSDQWKAKEMLAESFEDGIINSKEQQFLNGMKQNLKDIEFNRSTSLVASSIKGLKKFFGAQSNASDEDIARNIKTLVGDVSGGVQPDAALRKIIQKEVALKIPNLSSFPKTGVLRRDANGNVIRIFPDGSYVDEKPNKA